MCNDIAIGNLGTLFHYIAQLTGELEAAVQGMDLGRFNAERRTTHGCPREPRDHASATLGTLGFESRLTQNLFDLTLANAHPLDVLLHHFQDGRSHQRTEPLLQSPHTSLAAIGIDD